MAKRKGRGGGGKEEPRGRRERREAREAARTADAGGGSTVLEWIKTLGIAFLLYLVIRTFILQTFVITSGSMEDTLLVGDFLMVNRVALGTRVPATEMRLPGYSEPRRGDVLVFDPPHEDELTLVKRMVGMPGDTLHMEDKILHVNGEPQDEPYVKWLDPGGDEPHPWMEWQREYLAGGNEPDDYRPTRDNWGPLVVPEDHYFALGDNRDFSLDSRYWGLLERWRLEGRAVVFYYSYDRESPGAFSWLREVRWDRIGRRVR